MVDGIAYHAEKVGDTQQYIYICVCVCVYKSIYSECVCTMGQLWSKLRKKENCIYLFLFFRYIYQNYIKMCSNILDEIYF